VPYGPGTIYERLQAVPNETLPRGRHFIVLVEADADEAVIWTRPEDWKFDPEDPLHGLGATRHGSGFLAGLETGFVQMFSLSLPADTLRQFFTVDPLGAPKVKRRESR